MIGKLIIILFILFAIAGYFGVSIYFDVTVELPDEDEQIPDQNNTSNNTTNMSYYSGNYYGKT